MTRQNLDHRNVEGKAKFACSPNLLPTELLPEIAMQTSMKGFRGLPHRVVMKEEIL